MKNMCIIFVAMTTFLCFSAFAAKPVKITPGQKGILQTGENYRNYVVKCSNGKSLPITAWEHGRKWCIGEASQESCSKKQIKAAKRACKVA